MTNVEKMCIRMFAPGVVISLGGTFAAILVDSIRDIPLFSAASGGLSWASALIETVTVVAALSFLALQGWRLWRWQQGAAEHYCHCSCLLGDVRNDGRFGPYRKCLGCGGNRSTRYD